MQSSTLSDFYSLIADVEQCAGSFGRWMTGNRLKLNNDKTEAFLGGSRTMLRVSEDNRLTVGDHISFKFHVKMSGSTLTLLCLW